MEAATLAAKGPADLLGRLRLHCVLAIPAGPRSRPPMGPPRAGRAWHSAGAGILVTMPFLPHAATGAGPLAFMFALSAGSVWSVVIGLSGSPSGWMAVPVALLVAFAPKLVGIEERTRTGQVRGVVRNLLLLAMATAYAQYLGAAGVVGRGLGFDFLLTLREIGPAFAFWLARTRAEWIDWAGLAAGFALVIAAAPASSRRQGP